MPKYKDQFVQLTQSRLMYFDGGYGLAPVLDAIALKPNHVTYQIRSVINISIDFCLQHDSDVAILVANNGNAPLELVLSYFVNVDKTEFYIVSPITGHKVNSLTESLAARITHHQSSDIYALLDILQKSTKRFRIAVVNALDEKISSLIIPSFNNFKLDLLFILNFSAHKGDPYYFHLKGMGFLVHELSDGLGLVIRW